MTLNGVLALFCVISIFGRFEGYYVTVVEDRPTYSLQNIFYFWPKLTHLAARSLCDN